MELIRGTTPTISISFSTVEIDSIAVAYLVIKDTGGSTVIEKNINSAVRQEHSLDWKLTQEESLSLTSGTTATIYCDWRLADGTRGRSHIEACNISDSGMNEVI